MTMRAMRTSTALGVTTTLALLVSGCGAPEPTVTDTPEIVWMDGVEPSSPLEDEELVQVARRGEIGMSLAWNTGDFTIAQLADNVGRRYVEALAESYARQDDNPSVDVGPQPWEPLEILEEFPEGGGVVRVCAGRLGAGWHIEPDTPEDAELLRPDGQLHEITIREEGGRLKYDGFTPVTVEGSSSCDAGGVPVGLFDPAPELPDVPVTKTVRDPLPAEG